MSAEEFWGEVLEVLQIFKYDLDDSELARFNQFIGFMKKGAPLSLFTLFKERFAEVVATEDQALIVEFFKSVLGNRDAAL